MITGNIAIGDSRPRHCVLHQFVARFVSDSWVSCWSKFLLHISMRRRARYCYGISVRPSVCTSRTNAHNVKLYAPSGIGPSF